MPKFRKGDQVIQNVTPIEGEVTGFQVDQETGNLLVQVDWVGADGHASSRFFTEDEINAKPITPAPVV